MDSPERSVSLRRRRLCRAGLALAVGPAVPARGQARPARVGTLSFGAPPSPDRPDPEAAFYGALRDLGYVEGRNIVFERRFAMGRGDRLAALAAELVEARVDVIATSGPALVYAVSAATRTIPIVAVAGGDPVRDGWAQSLSRPGGNVTGLTATYAEMAAKRLELLKVVQPSLAHVAVLYEPTGPDPLRSLRGLESDARALGIELQQLLLYRPQDVEPAFEQARAARAQAILAYAESIVFERRERIAELAIAQRLPSMSDFAFLAQSGFLLGYGADVADLARRAAGYVDRILKGERPAEMPIERPTRLQLAVNRRTADAIGVPLPQTLMLQANMVVG